MFQMKTIIILSVIVAATFGSYEGGSAHHQKVHCAEKPKKICNQVKKPFTETVFDKQCNIVPQRECKTELVTVTKEETKNQCRDVPEKVCKDFTTQKCETHQNPVQETQYNEECYTKIKQVKFTLNLLD